MLIPLCTNDRCSPSLPPYRNLTDSKAMYKAKSVSGLETDTHRMYHVRLPANPLAGSDMRLATVGVGCVYLGGGERRWEKGFLGGLGGAISTLGGAALGVAVTSWNFGRRR